jgi:hypothetical protein
MARYVTLIDSRLPPAEAFAYLADFTNARFWDPSVSEGTRDGGGDVGPGSAFDLVSRFGGRDIPLRYTIVAFEPPKLVVLEASRKSFTSRDTITVEAAEPGSRVHYDATLAFKGPGRVLDPIMQLIFNRVGRNATAGLKAALNP